MNKNKADFLRALTVVSMIIVISLVVGCGTQMNVKFKSQNSFGSFSNDGMSSFLPQGDFKANLTIGKEIFNKNCLKCHSNRSTISKKTVRNKTPMDIFKYISGEPDNFKRPHPAIFSQNISINDRWNVIFYIRSFYSKKPTGLAFDSKFGQNCATCHGKRGHGDGPLSHKLYPKPANFNEVARLYNRTDEFLYSRITHGAYPTAMPPWKDIEGMTDPAERWRFVDYVRSFTYTQ